jgi:hypothetical protein
MNLVMYDVYLLNVMMLFMGSKYLEDICSIKILLSDNNNQT